MRTVTYRKVFFPTPVQWGFRGDEVLWRRMANQLAKQKLPLDQATFEAVIIETFYDITGYTLFDNIPDEDEFVTIPSLAEGGMSEGMVSLAFWKKHAIPELCMRFRKIQKGTTD